MAGSIFKLLFERKIKNFDRFIEPRHDIGLHRKLTFNEILRCLMIRVPFNQNDVDMDIDFKIYDLPKYFLACNV